MPDYPEFPIVKVAVDVRKLSHEIETTAIKIETFDCIKKDEDDNYRTVLMRIRYKAKAAK